MRKLADLIRRATRGEPTSIGFVPGARKAPPTMVLVALIGERWAQGTRDAIAAGADALLLSGRPNERELAEAVSAADDRPCGLLAPDITIDQLAGLRQAGLDFLVLTPQGPADALQDEEFTFLLRLAEELTDTQLRTIDALPVAAIYVEQQATAPTIMQQMALQRISALARKPLLLPVRHDIKQQELLSLRDAGVTLAGINLRERNAVEALQRLRQVIDSLPRRRRQRPEDRPEVTLPGVVGEAMAEEEEEEEEEDRADQLRG